MKTFRRERAAEQIRRELTQILDSDWHEEELPSFYIHKVELAPDMSQARVLLGPAVVGESLDEAAVLKPLRRITPKVRAELVKRIQMRRAPQLVFQVDRGQENRDRIDTLLDRIKKRSGPGGVALVLVGLSFGWFSARAGEAPLERFESQAEIMGTTFRVAAYGPDKKRLSSVVYSAFDEARRIDGMLSNYREDSELSKVNQSASEEDVQVSQELADLLKACMDYSRRTEGAFDITVGRLMETWGFFKGTGELPSARAVRKALSQVGFRSVEIQGRRVRLLREGLLLDPGGVGKGYAVDRMASWLEKYGIESAMISAGTSTLFAIGAPPDDRRGWRVELRSPSDPKTVADTIYLSDESLSTSGSYEKFFTVDGVRYSHIMDPRMGFPAQGTAAVSVRADSALDTEVWTTALFVLGAKWAKNQAPGDLAVFFCPDGEKCAWLGS